MSDISRSCYIVGSGPSMCGFDYEALRSCDTITINQSLFVVPNPTYFVTKDYTWVNKAQKVQNKPLSHMDVWGAVDSYFIVGMREPRMVRVGRDCIDTKFDLRYNLSAFKNVIYTSSEGGIGMSFDDFRNGGDSGYAALQLAVILGYSRIFLLGIDMFVAGDRTHCHRDYGNRSPIAYMNKLTSFYKKWVKALGVIHETVNCQVVSCSPISRLNSIIPYQRIEDVL